MVERHGEFQNFFSETVERHMEIHEFLQWKALGKLNFSLAWSHFDASRMSVTVVEKYIYLFIYAIFKFIFTGYIILLKQKL